MNPGRSQSPPRSCETCQPALTPVYTLFLNLNGLVPLPGQATVRRPAGNYPPEDGRDTAPRPGPVSTPVCIIPSVTRNRPGKRPSHGPFAAGQYCRPLASTAATPGT